MKIGDLCKQDFVIGTGPEMSIREAASRMAEESVGCLIVTDRTGTLAGIITDRDIMTRVVAKGLDPKKVSVGEAMSHPVVTVSHKTDVEDAAHLLRKHEIRRLPVLDQHGKVLGVVSFDDLLGAATAELCDLAGVVSAACRATQAKK